MKPTRAQLYLLIAILAALLAGFAISEQATYLALAASALILLIIVMWNRMEWGIYIMAALFPFTYFQFVYGSINVQYIDLAAMAVALVWGVRTFVYLMRGRQHIRAAWFPAAVPMLLFAVSGALSLLSVESEFFGLSLKFLFRPIIFFYLMFVMLPSALISTERILGMVHRIMYGVGIATALLGAWSLIDQPIKGVFRAIPVPVLGIDFLGPNHNLIAEVLVMVIPIGYILFSRTKDIMLKNVYLAGTVFMCAINLLTFSRAGWLALGIEAFLLAILQYRARLNALAKSYGLYIAAVFIAPLAYLMYRLMTSIVAISSNINRLKLITIAVDLFREHPVVGNGVGSFTRLISGIQWYIIEYGEPLDAHGVYFKVLAEQGVLGVITWTILAGAIVLALYRAFLLTKGTRWGIITVASLLSVAGGMVFQLFGTAYYLSKFWFPIGVALAAAALAREHFSNHGTRTH